MHDVHRIYVYAILAISTTMMFDTIIPVMTTTTTMASDISTMSTTATPSMFTPNML